MPWIKKNLVLVLGGLVGLILLGGSGFFLFSQSTREGAVNAALEEKKTEWNRLNGLDPYPDEKNIKAVKEEAERLRKLAHALKGGIRPVEVPPVSDTYSLKLLIETTIDRLKREAEEAGVNLPDRYAFTFQRLREMPQFESNAIPRLAEQVSHLTTLSHVLYAAKIHSLDSLRRPPVLKDESGTDYLSKGSATNKWVIRTPYELSFRAFSSELAEVLRGFATLEQCVAIKTINVEPTTLPQSSPTPTMMPMPTMPSGPYGPTLGGGPPGMDPALAARYGLGAGGRAAAEGGGQPGGMDAALRARYGLGGSGDAAMRSRYGGGAGAGLPPPPTLSAPMAPTAPMSTPPPGAGPSVVLDEKPLRVILQLDFVKPIPDPEAARRAPRAEKPPGGATADPANPAPPSASP